jgi:hypothetical protein
LRQTDRVNNIAADASRRSKKEAQDTKPRRMGQSLGQFGNMFILRCVIIFHCATSTYRLSSLCDMIEQDKGVNRNMLLRLLEELVRL